MSDGAILLGSSLLMSSTQKTFGIALSRDMAPAARILVYCVVNGEVLTDSLTFYVQDTILKEVLTKIHPNPKSLSILSKQQHSSHILISADFSTCV